MASSRMYYDLVSSLPPLPYFERANRNPINRDRLNDRMLMLEPEDQEIIGRAAEFLAWQRQPAARTDKEMVEMYSAFFENSRQSMLRAMVQNRMNLRTVMAALRRKRKGLHKPEKGEPWGVGPWVISIEKNWDAPHFKLASVFTWIPDAQVLLDTQKALDLDRLLMAEEWKWLDGLMFGNEFSFEALLAYLFKWDILDLWLSYGTEAASERFEELVAEVTGEHTKLFG
jgi:hypothetical protein